jgi:small subunit ribosomal protein S17
MPKKEITGKVVSNKMDKTVVVAVESSKAHVRYEKKRQVTRKFKAHDERNSCQIGDIVRIRECRPLSRDKRWLVIDISGHSIAEIETSEPEVLKSKPKPVKPEVMPVQTNDVATEQAEEEGK